MRILIPSQGQSKVDGSSLYLFCLSLLLSISVVAGKIFRKEPTFAMMLNFKLIITTLDNVYTDIL